MRVPAGLVTAGQKLWRAVDAVFDLKDEPHKTQILRQACKVADIIADLDEAADEGPLTVRGSQNQPVISPLMPQHGLEPTPAVATTAGLDGDGRRGQCTPPRFSASTPATPTIFAGDNGEPRNSTAISTMAAVPIADHNA
jgi:hypothetical protein